MQTKSTSYGKKLLALMLSLLMLVSVLPVSAWAAADAKPEKITLVGSSDALEYEFVDYLTFAWEDIPHYKVTVPAGTKTVQLYGTVYLDKASSSGSGYTQKDGLNDWPPPVDYWSADEVGSSAPYTIETRTSGYEKNLSLVKTRSYADTSSAYILEFVEKDDSPAAPAPVLTADLSTAAVTYTCGDTANALAVQATGSGTLSYQWQVSTTSAADGFEDITDATQSSYTPSTEAPGSFWYRVVVTNTVAGNKPTSVTSAVAPVTVNVPEGMRQVKIITSQGRGTGMTLTLKDAAGQPVSIPADTSGDYTVYEFLTAPGVYTYEARDTVRGSEYLLGTGTLTVTEGTGEQTFELYLVYVYAVKSGWTADDFTTEVKAADGTVMTPGQPHQFASYVGYPYLMVPGTYTWSIQPSEARAAEGYQATQPARETLKTASGAALWSATPTQIVNTDFVVPKGAHVVMTGIPSTTYGQGALVAASADLTGDDSDVYTFRLVAGSSYIYRATGDGLVTNASMFKFDGSTSRYDLTKTMTGDPKAILRDEKSDAADIRLNGVDYTGSVALTVGGMKQLRPLRMFQIANNSSTGMKGSTLEPVFHYTALDVDGTNVVSVDDSGRITANSAGTAIVLVTYDAMYVADSGWSINKNKTFGAIWPENTGVVVVEVGKNAATGPDANMTINNGDRKVAGNKLDAEADVLYYTNDSGCQYTFQPASGSTVTLLRPTLTETAMTYTGGFGTDGVTTKGGDVTLTLTEGKNIVKISKDGADTYQVITVKKAGVVITNKTDPTRDILPGDTVTVQLTGVYHPANTMANLYNLYAYASYTDPGSNDTVTGYKNLFQRHLFDRADGNDCRTVEVKIPANWDADEPYVLTDGVLNFYGNGKDIGSHRNSLPDLSTNVPYIGSYSSFALGALPDITIPVVKPNTADVTFSMKDDSGNAIDSCTIQLTNSSNDTVTINATAASATRTLASGKWSYVVTKEGYLPAKGTLTVVGGEDQAVNVELSLVTAIQVKTLPKKTVYTEGDTLNTAGLVVQAVTRNGASTLSADQYTLSPTLLETVGQQTITVTFGQLTTTFEVTVREDIVTLETTLEDGITQRNSRMTFDVFAKDGDGNKLPASEVTVLLNGDPVSVNWDDDTKTSYTLHFTKEGVNTVEIKAHKASLTYTITYVKAEPGDVVGKAVFTVEALSLGGGYIIEPCYVDIIEGENAAQALARLLEERGFTYSNTGSLESGFYLSHIQGDALAGIDPTGDSIPQALREKLEEKNFDIQTRTDETSLGEFDYTSASGWMYCLKNVFPNVGFADSYLSEGDVVRVQFTVAYGSDIGGGFAMGSGDSAGYFDMANKDALTRRVAAINAEIEANPYYLEQNCLTKAYDAAMDVLTTLYVSQADVDAALADLPDPPVGHQLTAVEKVPATCETAGVEAYWKCSVCGKLFSDAEGKTETTLEKLAIPATGHAYGAPVWKWNDDFTASATFTCGNDDSHVENVTAEVTSAVTTPAACETTGVRTYTAKVTFEGEDYTDTKTEVIPATGHAYGEPVWKWNDDFTASATFTCGNDASHVKTVNATVTNEVTTAATCEADGVRTYTAKVTFEDKEYTDTKTEVIPATGHAYGAPVWKWNDDFTASATFTCGNDASHVETVNATVTNEVTTAATCETDGVRTYTAKVTFEDKEYTDTKTEVIPATGHAYGEPVWKWTDDFKATATFTCANDTTHVENVTAEVTSAVTTPAACEADGVRTYTAKVTFEDKEYTDTKTETLPALGHDYKDGKCSRCGAEEPTTPGKPATGDSSTLVLWLALLAVSGMAVTVIPSRKKRSR
ncbi:MAG: bacterial Ig-like domain-containing protein [Oscillospiraceae bacterium]